ncbi:MAG: hypothetical protein C4288_04185 [Leptolyngbya sp. ERB_1_1]
MESLVNASINLGTLGLARLTKTMHDLITPTQFTGLPSVISQFKEDPNALRIQKLLFYICKNRWESDSTRLNALSWRSLIEETRETYPTIEQLRSRLIHQIGMLNKSAEYIPIGQIILSVFERVYVQNAATIVTTPKLDQDVNVCRIKKLLIYICRQYWEADSSVIEQVSTSELIDELMQRYTTLEELRSGLSKSVRTLNKPIEYSLVSEVILRQVEPLYGDKEF